MNVYAPNQNYTLTQKQKELSTFLHERVKGAFVRARFTSAREMDAPTSFFFSLKKSVVPTKQMVCPPFPDGTLTTDQREMRMHTLDFYRSLYRAEDCSRECQDKLLQGLPQLSCSDRGTLDADFSLEELTAAVSQMASGHAPGMDGPPADFYKRFWGCLGTDLWDVLLECIRTGLLPALCRNAMLSLFPMKGDLALLKNWRPVALLCTDYKLLSKVLANRLENVMDLIIHRYQSYCVPDRSIMDNLFLIRDLLDVWKLYIIDFGIVLLDQEKAFDRVDHNCFSTLRAFGFENVFFSTLGLLYRDAQCVVKVGGGLSCPVKVQRGIRQGCPISGQLYSLAVEPLLAMLRTKLSGILFPDLCHRPQLVVSTYANDIRVFIKSQMDVDSLSSSLDLYQRA